jgi:hypothetical protein
MSQFFSLPTISGSAAGILGSIWAVWESVWWIATPLIAIIIFWEAWLLHLHHKWVHGIHWTLLEIKVPKNILKTPKAMEQIFAAAHAPYSYGYKWYQKYLQGMDEYWMSFELIGRAGETHFYLRVPNQYRNMMESAIYGQYPDAEITEANDYLDEMPKIIPNRNFDLSGFEEEQRHPSYIPIRTYPMFEEAVEEHRIDPIGGLMEVMSKLKEGEQIWYQILVRPTGENTFKAGIKRLNEMYGIEEKKKGGLFSNFDLGFTMEDAIRAPFVHPGERAAKKEEANKFPRLLLSPNDKELSEAIQEKIAKLSFDATVRFMVITQRDVAPPDSGYVMSLHGFMRQFNTQNLNQLKPNSATTTAGYAVKGLFKKQRLGLRKRLLYEHYKNLLHGPTAVLSIEELATIFHFPLGVVSTTELEKIGSRKGSPPASLPVIEEAEIS